MEFHPDELTYRCNACGHRHEDAHYCDHCGTPMCPECRRAGCITNMIAMKRIVSQEVELRSQMKKKKGNKPKPHKNPTDRIAALMEITK